MTTASKRKWRCRGCGNYLDLEETHHGSHVVYDQAGARECGPVDEVKQHFLRFACGAVVTCYPKEVSATPDVAGATPRVAECPRCRGDQYLQPCPTCGGSEK
mgnify:CR=1 FL=1